MLLLQMLVVPIALTAGIILIGPLLHVTYGDYSSEFKSLLAAVFGSFIIGGLLGLAASRLYKNKPETAAKRYIPLLIPTAYALIFAVVLYSVSQGNFGASVWGYYVLKNPAFIVADFLLAFSGFTHLIPMVELSGYAGFTAIFLLLERLQGKGIKSASAFQLRLSFAALTALLLVYMGITNKEMINSGLIELRYGKSTVSAELTEYDLASNSPFTEDNGLVKLEGEASLQFTELDQMPRLDGATAAYPVYAAFAEAVYKGLGDYYRSNNTGAQPRGVFVDGKEYPYTIIRCTKTQQAYENLMYGEVDVIFVAEPSASQVERIRGRNDDFVLTPIGSEAFVFFTNTENPVDNLTVEQVRDIYAGRTTNWKQVGGPNKRIIPYQRPENSGSQTVMQNKVMEQRPMVDPSVRTRVGGMGGVIRQVAEYQNAKNAIGYSFMYYSSSMTKENRIKYVGIDGIKPTKETVRDRSYPFTVPLYAVTLKSNANPQVGKLLEWVVSEQGQSLVEKTGYVPVR
jgi:phosphate transport system substrate-binding protein